MSYNNSCKNYGGAPVSNPVVYDPDSAQVMVSNTYYACSQDLLAPPPVSGGCATQQPGDNNWFRSDNTNGTLVNIQCNVNAQLSFYGSAKQTCQLSPGGSDGMITYQCNNGAGGNGINTVHFHPSGPQVAVNGTYYQCSTNSAPQPYDNPPADAAKKAWFRADNNFGTLTNINCNIPVLAADSYNWSQPNSAVYQVSGQMDGLIEKLPNMTVESAQQHADANDAISFFYLGGDNSPNLQNGEAAFFSGSPNYQIANGSTLYAKISSAFIQNLPLDIYAYYSFNINGNDDSGQNNNASLNDDVLFEQGHEGNALQFSTDNSGAQVALPALIYPQNRGFSFTLWIKPDSSIVTTGTNGLASILGPLYFDANSNKIKYLPSNTSFNLQSSSALSTDTWSHVAVTYSHVSNQADLYINGNLIASATNLPTLNFTPWGQTIGGIPATASPPYTPFLGSVDEVYLYERALGAAEIGYLAGFHKSNRRSAYPQSVKTDGQPGYESEKRCEDSYFQSFWRWVRGRECYDYADYCQDQKIDEKYCPCPAGTTANSPAGTGCSSANKTAVVTLSDVPRSTTTGNLKGAAVTVTNATYAFIHPTPRDAWPSPARMAQFKNDYCDGTSKETPSTTAACYKLEVGASFKCEDLAISTNDNGVPVLNYPNYNVQEWANQITSSLRNVKNFAVINANFWETSVTAPCGAPLGNLIESNGVFNSYQRNSYDSMVLTRNSTSNLNSISFYEADNIPLTPPPHTAAIAGLLLRHDGTDTTAEQMKNWPNGKPTKLAGRTAVGYDPAADELKFIVLPPSSTAKSGLTAKGMLSLFDSKYTNVLLLDGGGSSTLSYWEDGAEKHTVFKKQKSGDKIRTLPTAIIIAPTTGN